MRYKIKKETNPTRPTCGKYKAVAVHYHTVDSKQLIKEAAQRMGTHKSNVLAVMSTVAAVVNAHLREGDRVRLPDWGMMKLEIESEKVEPCQEAHPWCPPPLPPRKLRRQTRTLRRHHFRERIQRVMTQHTQPSLLTSAKSRKNWQGKLSQNTM